MSEITITTRPRKTNPVVFSKMWREESAESSGRKVIAAEETAEREAWMVKEKIRERLRITFMGGKEREEDPLKRLQTAWGKWRTWSAACVAAAKVVLVVAPVAPAKVAPRMAKPVKEKGCC